MGNGQWPIVIFTMFHVPLNAVPNFKAYNKGTLSALQSREFTIKQSIKVLGIVKCITFLDPVNNQLLLGIPKSVHKYVFHTVLKHVLVSCIRY